MQNGVIVVGDKLFFLLRVVFFVSLKSTAFASAWLIFGFAIVAALLNFAKIDHTRSFTIFVYAVPVVSLLVMLIRSFGSKIKVNRIDLTFAVFFSLVVFRMVFDEGMTNLTANIKYFNFIFAMAVLPYLLGRLMRFRDVELFRFLCLGFGIFMLPLIAFDLLMTVGRHWRWSIFGLNHGSLVVAGTLCVTLITLSSMLLSPDVLKNKQHIKSKCYIYTIAIAIGIVVALLVIVAARGWFLASIFGVATITLYTRTRTPTFRTLFFLYVLAIAAICFAITPTISFYLEVLSTPVIATAQAPVFEGCPILGEDACQPFKEGNNSVAMRWVLYREAFWMFIRNPLWGVGPAHFGDCSCLGKGWYPHNSLLQAFAELGLLGGSCLLFSWYLSVKTLINSNVVTSKFKEPIYSYVLAIIVSFILADQIYGDYLKSIGVWMSMGISASLFSQNSRGVSLRND